MTSRKLDGEGAERGFCLKPDSGIRWELHDDAFGSSVSSTENPLTSLSPTMLPLGCGCFIPQALLAEIQEKISISPVFPAME